MVLVSCYLFHSVVAVNMRKRLSHCGAIEHRFCCESHSGCVSGRWFHVTTLSCKTHLMKRRTQRQTLKQTSSDPEKDSRSSNSYATKCKPSREHHPNDSEACRWGMLHAQPHKSTVHFCCSYIRLHQTRSYWSKPTWKGDGCLTMVGQRLNKHS